MMTVQQEKATDNHNLACNFHKTDESTETSTSVDCCRGKKKSPTQKDKSFIKNLQNQATSLQLVNNQEV